MKSSHKLSFASLAALGLPLVGVGVAAAQDVSSPDSAKVIRVSVLNPESQGSVGELQSSGSVSLLAIAQEDGDGAVAPEILGADIDPMRGWSEDNLDAYAAYWEAGYNYRQLLALTEEWNLSEFEAKARAGAAILAGDTSTIDSLVDGIEAGPEEAAATEAGEAFANPTDPFWDAGFTYDDAVILAEEWNVETYEAKLQAAALIEAGDQDDVEALLVGS